MSPSYLEELYKVSSPQTVGLCYPLSFVDGEDTYTPYSITSDYKEDKLGETMSYKQDLLLPTGDLMLDLRMEKIRCLCF